MICNPFLYKKLYQYFVLWILYFIRVSSCFIQSEFCHEGPEQASVPVNSMKHVCTVGLEQEAGYLPIYFPALLVRGRRAVLGHIPSNDTFTEYSATSYHGIFSFLPSAQTMQYPNQTSCHRWSVEKGQPCRSKRTLRRVRHPQTPALVSGKWMDAQGPTSWAFQ